MARRRLVYEGKTKILYEGPESLTLVQYFKDDVTAEAGAGHAIVDGKGVLNNRISEYVMSNLNQLGVPTHFMRRLNMREQLVRTVDMFPLQIVARSAAAGEFAKRLGIDEGESLPRLIIEFYLKNDELGNPLVNEDHIAAFNWASGFEVEEMMSLTVRTFDFLSGMFLGVGLRLVDLRIECGRTCHEEEERVVIADEISPDNCRLWDIASGRKLDKDGLALDAGQLIDAYSEVARRLGVVRPTETANPAGPRLVHRSVH